MTDSLPSVSSPDIHMPNASDELADRFISMPKHVAIIMDGNGRWAKSKEMPSIEGHRAGSRQLREIVQQSAELGIEVLTVFAFSSENWRRPEDEVAGLMQLFIDSLDQELPQLHANGICIRFIGDLTVFSKPLVASMSHATALTAGNARMTLVVAVNYGGRWDMAQAARALAMSVVDENGVLDVEQLAQCGEVSLGRHMCLADLPELDLCIRTGYEQRISNFLLWQVAYAELYFADCYWPDFGTKEFANALAHFAQCQRRFGLTGDQIAVNSAPTI